MSPSKLTSSPSVNKTVYLILGGWLILAIAVGLLGIFEGAPAPVIGGTNALLIVISLVTIFKVESVAQWALSVSLRVLVFYHVVRFVGIAFLLLYANGTIPGEFAITAGWGDIIVAVTCLAVGAFALPVTSKWRHATVLGWNILGLADILFVLATGMRMGLADVSQMAWITVFPMSLLPTFIVPLVIVTHVLIFIRLRSELA